jgi:hypothetical protein
MLNGIVPVPDISLRTATTQAINLPTRSLVLAAMKPPITGNIVLPTEVPG